MTLDGILDVIETTCKVHRFNIAPTEQRAIAMGCWVVCGDDVKKTIDFIEASLRHYENR